MNIDKILKSPLINKSALAKEMFPKLKKPEPYLSKKINGKYGQTLGFKDREEIKRIILNLISDEN